MNNFFKLLIVLFSLSFSSKTMAQSFHKKALVFDAKLGIDVYDTKNVLKLKSTGKDTTETGKAVSRNFGFGLEYGVMDYLGIGIRAKFNRFFAEPDDSTKLDPKHTSLDYMATINYHPIRGKVFNLFAGINIGGSHLNLIFNDINKTEVYGDGLYFDIHVSPRIYLKNFGFQFDLGMPLFNYPNISSNNINFNNEVLAKLKGIGYNFGIGIQYKFFSAKAEEGQASHK